MYIYKAILIFLILENFYFSNIIKTKNAFMNYCETHSPNKIYTSKSDF